MPSKQPRQRKILARRGILGTSPSPTLAVNKSPRLTTLADLDFAAEPTVPCSATPGYELWDAFDCPLFLLAPDLSIRHANALAVQLAQQPLPWLVGRSLSDALPRTFKSRELNLALRAALRAAAPQTIDWSVVAAVRHETAWSLGVRPCTVAGAALAVTLHDATRECAARQAFQESEERFRAVLHTTMIPLLISRRADGLIVYCNQRFADMMGVAVEQLLGRATVDFYFDPADRQLVTSKLNAEGILHDIELRLKRDNGEIFWVSDAAQLLDFGGEQWIISALFDITDRKRLQRDVLEISTREQQRIGRELHDSLGQELTGLTYMAKGLAKRLAEASPQQALALEQIATGLQRCLGDLRSAIRGLAPVEVDAIGLMVALEQLAQGIRERTDIDCQFEYDHPVPLHDVNIATHLFRIAQEAANNAIRHAQPTRITIRLASEDGMLRLRVTDDGRGIGPGRDRESGMGLQIMRYRAGAIGATLDVCSSPAAGTCVTCALLQEIHDGQG